MNSILNKVLIFFIGVTACAAFISPPAQADGMDYQNYGIVGLGVNIPTGGLDEKNNQKFSKNKRKSQNNEKIEIENNPEADSPKSMGYNTYDIVA